MSTMGLIPRHFHDAITRRGESVAWHRALPSPAENPETALFDRTAETDYGYVYQPPVTIIALLLRQQSDFLDQQFGLIRKGDLIAVVNPEEAMLTAGDKIGMPDREDVTMERVTRGATDTDALRMPDPLEVELVADTAQSYTIAPTGTSPAPGAYDCQLVAGGLKWLAGGTDPNTGTVFSVRYRYRPLFWVTGAQVVAGRPGLRDRDDATAPTGTRKELFVQRAALSWRRPVSEVELS